MDKDSFPKIPLVLGLLLVSSSLAKSQEQEPQDACAQTEGMQHGLMNKFSIADYGVLLCMLVISCGIGMFYGFFGQKQKTSSDFLLGGSQMGTYPMALSLAASFITAIELLGNPAEMFNYGAKYWLICLPFIIVVPITSRLYLPVFMKLRLTSSYEYFEMRFNPAVRTMAAALYILQMVLYTSVTVYAPALALSHVTGMNVYVAVTAVYFVCIFYASQGGMKAVIMTDTFQGVVLMGSIILIMLVGNNLSGGTSKVFNESWKSGRLELVNFMPDPTIRHSVWSILIGGTIYWVSMFCANQASIQKYLSVEKISQARIALWISSAALIVIYTINFYTGMVIYSEYAACDPVQSEVIKASDQLLPLYTMNVLGKYQGLPGLFVAGIFAASLGTVASALNSLAAVTMKDFIGGAFGIHIQDEHGAAWSKWLSIMFGAVSFALVFVVQQLGSVMQVALSFNGMVGGVTLGLFSLGMFVPWGNSKGALVGASVSLALVLWIGIGTQIAQAHGFEPEEEKPISVAGCPCFNATESLAGGLEPFDNSSVFYLYRISYLWYSVIGFMGTLIIGLTVSLLTHNPEDPSRIHPDLLSPPFRTWYESFTNDLKEKLHLPIQEKDAVSPTSDAKANRNGSVTLREGFTNKALIMDDEKPITTPEAIA
ncbi:unnamed protein product [Bemisia tabaci]|uniref:Sodium-coupled monocarboxylate transporter 1 n=1 Tax=Bemisia tabaci TaxID=7038 RepID=A0A9P0EYM1_BEMTA|nr:unnamed protein product [Bemisia tabaci]